MSDVVIPVDKMREVQREHAERVELEVRKKKAEITRLRAAANEALRSDA